MTRLCLAACIVMYSITVFSQSVSINNTGAQPAAGAMLDIQHTAKGILIPRIALTGYHDSTTLPDRPTSLLVFNTAATSDSDAVHPGYYFWNNGRWNRLLAEDLSASGGWLLGGNQGTAAGTHFIGTTDNASLFFKVANNVAGHIGVEGNTSFGYEAHKSYPVINNVAIGMRALYSNFNWYNVAVGDSVLFYNQGYANSAVGMKAMLRNTTGNYNAATGFSALFSNTTGSVNTAVGYNSMYANTSGQRNTAIGSSALKSNVTGSNNTAVGFEAGNNSLANGITAIGDYALRQNTSGGYNTAVGHLSMELNTSGTGNSALGTASLSSLTTGLHNVAVGYNSLGSTTTGSSNTALGYSALFINQTGSFLVAVGRDALYYNNSGQRNTAIGYSALKSNTTGNNNTALGFEAGFSSLGNGITAIGDRALRQNTTGTENTGVGSSSLFLNSTGSYNVALGHNSLVNSNNSFNVAIGHSALGANTSGNSNTAVGHGTMISNTTGIKNTVVGYGSNVGSNNLSNATAIGADAVVNCSNCMVLGNNANIGIGVGTPAYPLNFASALGDKISLYGTTPAHYGFGIQSGLLQIHTDVSSSDIALGWGNSGTFTENFRVKGDGNVSLGMWNGAATLTFGQALSKKIIFFRGGSGGEAAIGVFPNELRLQSDYSGAGITFGYDNAGTFQQNFRVEGVGNAVLRGNMYANGVLLTSDSRAKRDITLIEDGLDKITKLNAYHYYWKENSNDESLQTGVIAQEVQQLFPELVKTTNDGTLTVNYTGLIPYLIQSIREQQTKIEQLEKTNERLLKLEKEMEEIKKRLN